MDAPNARTLRIERLIAEIAALPLMNETVFHSVRFRDGKTEKEVCDVLLLHEGEAILLSVKAQGKIRDANATKRWAEKHSLKALDQLGGAYRTLVERSTWCQHHSLGHCEFSMGSIVPRHGIALIESRFEIALNVDMARVDGGSFRVPTSLMSLNDFSHIVHYLRTWRDLLKYLNSRNVCLRAPDSATLGAEVALLGYYTAMRDTFNGCVGIADAKIVTARGEHVRPDSAFRDNEVMFANVLEDFMREISRTGDVQLPTELQHNQGRIAATSQERDAVRDHFCRLTVQERAALGEQICHLCRCLTTEDATEPVYAGVRFDRRPSEAYVVVAAKEADDAELAVVALDLMIASCVYYARPMGFVLVLNQVGADLKFQINRIEGVQSSVEMMIAGQEYFGQSKQRKIGVAR
ncbi:hypothetical protein [Sorangium sp. So ce1000]|uniref:hypothetical protein n=1 Tax=Sorangium sp. So ce1000 TaxID=3133325 RepID=UPI003F616753